MSLLLEPGPYLVTRPKSGSPQPLSRQIAQKSRPACRNACAASPTPPRPLSSTVFVEHSTPPPLAPVPSLCSHLAALMTAWPSALSLKAPLSTSHLKTAFRRQSSTPPHRSITSCSRPLPPAGLRQPLLHWSRSSRHKAPTAPCLSTCQNTPFRRQSSRLHRPPTTCITKSPPLE